MSRSGSETFGITSEGLGEMFEGDFADRCVKKFPIILMGDEQHRQACTDREQRPPLARTEFLTLEYKIGGKTQDDLQCVISSTN